VAADLYQVTSDLFRALPGVRRRVRLLGVAGTGLVAAGEEQLALLRGERWGEVERAVDRIEKRFGPGSAMPATLLERGRRPSHASGEAMGPGGDPPGRRGPRARS
jgi:hypothetical protein